MLDRRHPDNHIEECRHPGLRCDRICLECRGDFDIVDRKTGRWVGDVSDTVVMNRMLREFGEFWDMDNPPGGVNA